MYVHSDVNPSGGAVNAAGFSISTAAEPAGSREIAVADLTIRRLRRAGDIRELAQLRGPIDLAAAVAADPHFLAREKKETNWAWSSPSSCTAS